jgi:glutamate/tyrosine decarboxylase-like PLP-dependent enzyme
MSELRELLRLTAERVADYRVSAGDRPVAPRVDSSGLRAALGGPLPEEGSAPFAVIERLATAVEPALMTSVGPRYFGVVVGGALDAATCADVLTTGWDQLAFNPTSSSAAATVEEVAGDWLKQALGLPGDASFGLVTGAQGANNVALAAARHRVLARVGWDVEAQGLAGAPRIRVVANEERHATIDRALRLLGIGADAVEPVAADANGAVDSDALARALDGPSSSPTIVCLQAGNVNTGACDDLAAACDAAHQSEAWVHVDGAFGLWAAASSSKKHLVSGLERADSWAVDGHKWLNVPYDTGYVFCADGEAHAASMSYTAAYLEGQGAGSARAPSDYVPESSRRARGFATWAALCELGQQGIAELVDRCCALARRFGEQLGAIDGVEIANDIVLNQVLVSFGSDERTDRVIAAVQRDGTCWMGGTSWRGRRLMRISVSNWSTTDADVDRSVAAIRRLLTETG